MAKLCGCGKESKYCCPRCKKRTCSLDCVNVHKVEDNCSGVADKASFVKLSEFDNIQMISDYKFLENIKESIEASQRHLLPSFCNQNTQGMIRKKCIANNTIIKFMPAEFSRHKANKTCFKDNIIKWTIELIFPDRNTKILAHEVPENWTIIELIEKYKTESVQYSEYRFVTTFYNQTDITVSYFVQADNSETNTFHILDPHATIAESLKFKTVLEFPTIYITTKPDSYKTVECKNVNVKSEMIRLGLLNEGKRKKNKRRRTFKKQKIEKNVNSDSIDHEKTDVQLQSSNVKCEDDLPAKKSSFKDSVLALFGDYEENETSENKTLDVVKPAQEGLEEEGEILAE